MANQRDVPLDEARMATLAGEWPSAKAAEYHPSFEADDAVRYQAMQALKGPHRGFGSRLELAIGRHVDRGLDLPEQLATDRAS